MFTLCLCTLLEILAIARMTQTDVHLPSMVVKSHVQAKTTENTF